MENNIIFIEEHNEAFKEIYNFYELGKEKYTLLHIDEHDDMGCAYVKKKDIDLITKESLDHIVYHQLNVGNYILPLMYKKVLTDVIWLSNEPIESYCELQTTIKFKNNGFIMIGQKKVKPNGRNLGYLRINSSSDIQFIKNKKIIVSLDLDYFGSNDEKGEELLIEISKEEYYNLKNNKYHKLRLGLGSMIYSYQKENRYYLQIYGRMEKKKENVDIHTVNMKIGQLKEFFDRNCIFPKLIIICKSFKSNYTDEVVKKYMKENLYRILEEMI